MNSIVVHCTENGYKGCLCRDLLAAIGLSATLLAVFPDGGPGEWNDIIFLKMG